MPELVFCDRSDARRSRKRLRLDQAMSRRVAGRAAFRRLFAVSLELIRGVKALHFVKNKLDNVPSILRASSSVSRFTVASMLPSRAGLHIGKPIVDVQHLLFENDPTKADIGDSCLLDSACRTAEVLGFM